MSSVFVFEMLPDEMILKIYSYLRGSDVLYAFYNLNARLNCTITNYCRDMNLMAVPHQQFDYVICRILPKIGFSTQSFVLNGNWETIMSTTAFTLLFTSSISSMFSQLRKLVLKLFTGKRLLSFLDNIDNFAQLTELDIRFLKEDACDTLMTKVFASNNRRLRTISFDYDSISLSLSKDIYQVALFTNIQELKINLESIEVLLRLFTIVPNLHRLHVCIERNWCEQDNRKSIIDVKPLVYLTDFQLQFVDFFGMFDDIAYILGHMPSLQKLTLDLWTNDERLIDGENLTLIFPSSLNQFDCLIRFYFSESYHEIDHLLKSWPNYMQINYFLDEDQTCIILYTIPCSLRSTIISAKISKHLVSSNMYLQHVEDLQISNVKSLTEILSIVKHLYQLRRLVIDADSKADNSRYQYFSMRFMINVQTFSKVFELPKLGRSRNSIIRRN